MTGYDLWAPPSCKNDEAAAMQFVVSTSKRFGLQLADVNCIALSESLSQAGEYIDQLRLHSIGLRDIDTQQIIKACVSNYNKTVVFLAFIDCVTSAVKKWEKNYGLPSDTVWYEHPCSYDCKRTYVWAQDEFRRLVRDSAYNRLITQSAINTILEPANEPMFQIRGPVNRLLEWINFEYKNFLGFYPLPTSL